MNLTQILEKKKELLKQEVEQINKLQQNLNIAQQDALRIDGAILQIQELIRTSEEKDKNTKLKKNKGENK